MLSTAAFIGIAFAAANADARGPISPRSPPYAISEPQIVTPNVQIGAQAA